MQISDKLVERFRLPIASAADLSALQPVEIALSGFEPPGAMIVATDIEEAAPHASQLDILYRDANPSGTEFWDFDAGKVSTFVIPRRDGNDIEEAGYLFSAIISRDDARDWYRGKHGYATRFDEPVTTD